MRIVSSSENEQTNAERYAAACHAMQSGVAYEHAAGSDDGSPKHLRVGVNSALVSLGALVRLLVNKGVLTDDEYLGMIADYMEAEVEDYERILNEKYQINVVLR